jgi:hypothetical protein
MALLCSSRWSDQKCCETECVALKTSFQTRPMWALWTHFLARYRFIKWGSKLRIFYESLKIFNDFSRENHGNGGHEHGVRRGVFAGKLSFKKMSAGGRLCTLQENPNFSVPTIKVRPPDGISLSLVFFRQSIWSWHLQRRRPWFRPFERNCVQWTGKFC